LSEARTLDTIVASKAAQDDFVRTRWWWIRHAPVHVDEGRIYGQRDLPCDCSDAGVFSRLAALLPRRAIWLTSHLSRTRQTAQAILSAGDFEGPPHILPDQDLAEQHLGDWQGLDRRTFLMSRKQQPDSFWYAEADERAPSGDIVAVVHGGTIRAALVIALGLPPRAGFAFTIDNCSLTRLDHYQGREAAGWRVPMVNQHP
jgi:alpha-ribazole phosphatase